MFMDEGSPLKYYSGGGLVMPRESQIAISTKNGTLNRKEG